MMSLMALSGVGATTIAGQVVLPYAPTSALFFAIASNAAPVTPALTAPETHWPWLIVAALAGAASASTSGAATAVAVSRPRMVCFMGISVSLHCVLVQEH